MRKLYFSAALLVLTSCLNNPFSNSVDPDSDAVFLNGKYKSALNLTALTPSGKQYYFIKVWGFLKYYGDVNDVDTDWDEYFLDNILKVEALDKAGYTKFIRNTIALFPKAVLKQRKNSIKDYSLIDNAWFNNNTYFGKEVTESLTYIFENHNTAENTFAEQGNLGTIEFTNEKKYDDSDYPNRAIRLLGLARYWNIINYFYVYKNDMTEDWDTVLLDVLPKFSQAASGREYHIAVQEITSKLYDCHSMIDSRLLDEEVYGNYVPNFRTKLIDSTLIVRSLRVPAWDDRKIRVGDIITAIDGENAINRYNRFNAIMKGANPLSEQRIVIPFVFSSLKKKMKLRVLRNGKEMDVEIHLKNFPEFVQEENRILDDFRKQIVLKEISAGTAYINLNHIGNSNFEDNFEAASKYHNLILDLRNYPNGKTTLNLSKFIMPGSSSFFTTSYADVTRPGLLRKKGGYKLGSDNGNHYKGRVYVLVSEATQSEAEFLVMALQTNPRVKVIGSRTAGSDGNVQEFHFPGNINAVFTGIGIYYPNNAPTQRRGIKLDKEVNQTLKGIAEGRDEILEEALAL